MRKLKIFVFGFLLFPALIQGIFGQESKNDARSSDGTPSAWDMRNQQKQEQIQQRYSIGSNREPTVGARPRKLSEEEREKIAESLKEYENTRKLLLAPNAYYQKYAELLDDKKYGLARLFVDRNCDSGKTVSVQELEKCAVVIPVKGGGSYYSFRENRNSGVGQDWWDVHFVDNKFIVGNQTVEAVIADIGDVDIKDVKLKSDAVRFVNEYKPKGTLVEIKEQNKALENGVRVSDFTYKNSALVKPTSTYVLRSVAYRIKGEAGWNNFDRGIDVTIAFKIVGREKDGSITILWKELYRQEAPKIIFAKSDKLSDIKPEK